MGLVQEKYGYTKQKAEQDVDYFLKRMNLRAANGINAISITAAVLGSLLTIVIFRAPGKRMTKGLVDRRMSGLRPPQMERAKTER